MVCKVIDNSDRIWRSKDLLTSLNTLKTEEPTLKIFHRYSVEVHHCNESYLIVKIVLTNHDRFKGANHFALMQDRKGHASAICMEFVNTTVPFLIFTVSSNFAGRIDDAFQYAVVISTNDQAPPAGILATTLNASGNVLDLYICLRDQTLRWQLHKWTIMHNLGLCRSKNDVLYSSPSMMKNPFESPSVGCRAVSY